MKYFCSKNLLGRPRQLCDFEISLVYMASSRLHSDTVDIVSQNKKRISYFKNLLIYFSTLSKPS